MNEISCLKLQNIQKQIYPNVITFIKIYETYIIDSFIIFHHETIGKTKCVNIRTTEKYKERKKRNNNKYNQQ